MALVIKDRVKETTTTTGTGTFNLAGAVSGFEGFIQVGDGNTVYYVCTDNTSFEIGIGTFTDGSPDTLSRDTILQAKDVPNGTTDQKVNWGSGTRTIFCTYPADKAVFKDASNNINGTFVGNVTGNVSGTSGSTTGNAATATALETARTIGGVSFDGTGNINLPGVNTSGNQDTSGNAATATTLETAREINGTSFNGSANITVTAAAGTLTGSTLNSSVTASSLTSLGTLTSNLNLGGQDIVTTTSNQDIDLQTHGTGKVVVKGNTDDSGSNPGAIKLNCEANSHGQTIIAAPHSESASNTLTLPSTGGDARLVTTSSTATFTNKTFDVEGTGNSISNIDVADLKSGVLDTDISSVSGSDDTLASAKAIKTYVDAQVTAQDLDLTTDSGTIAIDLDSETLTVTGGTGIDTSASGNEVTIAGSDATTSSKGIASFNDTFFSLSSGAVSLDAAQTGITSLTNASLVIGRDADNDIDFSTDNEITFRVNAEDQIKLQDGALVPITDNNIDLGTSSIEFKNAFFDGTVTTDVLNVGLISSAVKHTGSYFWFGIDSAILYFGANFEVSLQHIHNIGLRLNSDKTLSFRDSAINIGSPADGDLDINADDEIELNSTLIDINGAVDISGNTDVAGTLSSIGNFDVNTNKFTVVASSGNTAIAGTLDVDSTLTSTGDFDVNTDKFTVAASSGNTAVAGNLDVSGTVTSTGNFDVNTNKFNVTASSGNTAIAGNLDVTGTVTSTGNFDVNTNKFNVIASSGNTSIAGTLDVTGAISGDSLAVTTVSTTGGIDVQNSDTTLTRASAGVIAVEGKNLSTVDDATALAIALG